MTDAYINKKGRKRNPPDHELISKVMDLRANGFSLSQIAQTLKIPAHRVSTCIKDYKIISLKMSLN